MALEGKKQTINMNNYSVFNSTRVVQFYANINSDTPENMDVGRVIIDQAAYKANRAAIMDDQIIFENDAYAMQDQMIAEKAATEGGTV